MTIAQLRSFAAQMGFPDFATAAAVAMAESTGDPSARNIVMQPAPGNLPERSFGLWQINTLAFPQFDEASLLDPTYNARAALAVSSGGRDWSRWSTYTSGKYRRWL
jgi:hypothetical protein